MAKFDTLTKLCGYIAMKGYFALDLAAPCNGSNVDPAIYDSRRKGLKSLSASSM